MAESQISDSSQLAADLLEALSTVLAGLQRAVPPTSLGTGLTRSQLTALRVLADKGPQTMQDLAASVGVSSPSMTATVKLLVENNLVSREHRLKDWRTVWVVATEAGLTAQREYLERRAAVLAGVLASLGSEHRALLFVSLPALRQLAEKMATSGYPSRAE